MNAKMPVLTPAIVKRVKRAGYNVSRHGSCLICGHYWDSCPHAIDQAYSVVEAVKMAEMLGINIGRSAK